MNIEATGQGLAVYDDDHYLIWPHEITEQQAAENGCARTCFLVHW
ncbi:MAG: hypothetical protein AAGB51_14020 [Planctomycetota bacterium]